MLGGVSAAAAGRRWHQWALQEEQRFEAGKNGTPPQPWAGTLCPQTWPVLALNQNLPIITIQLWFLELHDSPLELKGELQYLGENCHFRGEKMIILV